MKFSLFIYILFVFLKKTVAFWNPLNICFRDCCSEFRFDETRLYNDLKEKLHGQPLVISTVANALGRHFESKRPSKAMVLCFHGWTGTGKNYASQLIAENMFTKGMKSPCVRLFIATIDFTNPAFIDQYKENLKVTIIKQINKCSKALFIFDEVDKLATPLLDSIKPFLEHFQDVGGVDPRNAVFLFLSNSASKAINEMAYANWLVNKPRESISLSAIQSKLSRTAYNEQQDGKGGLWRSGLIESHVITSFIPFLPLEKSHVALCIVEEARRTGLEDLLEASVQEILNQVFYWPEDTQVFSLSGCKRIPELVKINHYSLHRRIPSSEL